MLIQGENSSSSAKTYIELNKLRFPFLHVREFDKRKDEYERQLMKFLELLSSEHELDPIAVVTTGDDPYYYVIDGLFRYLAVVTHHMAKIQKKTTLEIGQELFFQNRRFNLPKDPLSLIDKEKKFLSNKKIASEIKNIDKKSWLYLLGRLNAKSATSLTMEEFQNVLTELYRLNKVSEMTVYKEFDGLFPKRYIDGCLRECRRKEKLQNKTNVIELRSNGKKIDDIAEITDVPVRTVKRWIKQSDPEFSEDDLNEKENCNMTQQDLKTDRFKMVRDEINKVIPLTHLTEHILLVIHAIKTNLSVGEVELEIRIQNSNEYILNLAFALLAIYRYKPATHKYRTQILKQMEISEHQVEFIINLNQNFKTIFPEQGQISNWISRNFNTFSSYHNQLLLNTENDRYTCTSPTPVPITIGDEFYENLNQSLEQLQVLNIKLSESNRLYIIKASAQTVLRILNAMTIEINTLSQKIRVFI